MKYKSIFDIFYPLHIWSFSYFMYELKVGKSAFLLFDVASFWLIVYFQSASYLTPYIWSEASVNPILGMGRSMPHFCSLEHYEKLLSKRWQFWIKVSRWLKGNDIKTGRSRVEESPHFYPFQLLSWPCWFSENQNKPFL